MIMGIITSVLDKKERPLLMGILNVTPDSFFPGSRAVSVDMAVEAALRMESDGADIIDVGAESTRPGSVAVSEEEVYRRLFPLLDRLCREVSVPVSLDTRKGRIAERALDAGVSVINDISAMTYDLSIIEIVKKYKCDIILMHMEQTEPGKDPSGAVVSYLEQRAGALKKEGIAGDRIILDPGIGFGKDCSGNLSLFGCIPQLRNLGYPVLMGCSRKSFIGKITGREVEERLPGTLACTAAAGFLGADILRVHDIRENLDFMNMLTAIGRFSAEGGRFGKLL